MSIKSYRVIVFLFFFSGGTLTDRLNTKAIPIKCFVSHRSPSREGGSVGRAKKKE